MTRLGGPAIAWCLLTAGCLGSTSNAPDEPPTETSTTSPGTKTPTNNTPLPGATDLSFPHSLLWDDCHGFVIAFDYLGPNERFNPPPHPSWQPPLTDDGPLLTGMLHYGLDCTRFSHGGFERPVKVLFESADLDAAPDSCFKRGDWAGNVTYSGDALESIWFDDEEIADYFRTTYGMPAYYAEVRTEKNADPPSGRYIWTMTHDGQDSRFEVHVGDKFTNGNPFRIRMFWWNDTILGYMDWTIVPDSYDGILTTWHAEPPLIAAEWPSKDWGSTSNFMDDIQVRGEVHLFNDLLCEEPL